MFWAIERNWLLRSNDNEHTFLTNQLAEFPAVCLLGSAGLGKSWEIRLLADHERQLGREVVSIDLGLAATSGHALREQLDSAVVDSGDECSLFLDGLDEAMIPERQAAAVVEDWITNGLQGNKRLRIACRSAVWPGIVAESIYRRFPEEMECTVVLQPFSEDDIRQILEDEQISSDDAIDAIKQNGIFVLARQPLTLKLLLSEFRSAEGLSQSKFELFERSVIRMCQESVERDERGTTPDIPPDDLIEAAERLAIFSVTSGREEVVDLNSDPDAERSALTTIELSQLPCSSDRKLYSHLLRMLANTGLIVGLGGQQYGFLHRQFAEYLAGRRIALLPVFRARALLARDSGWPTGVAGPLRETAAVAASLCPKIADWISLHDPEIVGLSDIADEKLQRNAVKGLLTLFRKHKLTDSHLSRNAISLDGFCYTGVADDLRHVLQERGDGLQDVHACAIALAEAGNLEALADDIADLILDDSLPFDTRHDAGYALFRIGTEPAKKRLPSLIRNVTDHDDQ